VRLLTACCHAGREHDTFSEDPATLIMQTGRLFVRNLAYSATDEELHEAFVEYGNVTDAHVARDRESQKSKGVCTRAVRQTPGTACRATQLGNECSLRFQALQHYSILPKLNWGL
jgi:hypothetical protein